jgi:hypothetical protein
MGKTRAVRLQETIDFIGQSVPAAERQSVENYVSQAFAAFASQALQDAELDKMSLGGEGQKSERAMRRSAMLMTIILGAAGHVAKLKTMTPRSMTIEFYSMLYRVRLMADMESNTVQLLRDVFETKLRAQPEIFLAHNVVMILGATTNRGENNILDFHFYYEKSRDRYLVAAGPPPVNQPGSYAFRAVSIPAVDWKDVTNRGKDPARGSFAGLVGTKVSGESVLVTTQFTGCAFCLKRHNGVLFAAHVSPSDMPIVNNVRGPTILAQQMTGQSNQVTPGNFTNAASTTDPFRVFGAGYSNIPGHHAGYPLVQPGHVNYMTIIAFNRSGQWRFFSQKNVDHKVDSVISFQYS